MASQFTTIDAFDVLCSFSCHECELFGPLLDLFTCQRRCLRRVNWSESLLSFTANDVEIKLGSAFSKDNNLPVLLTLPGTYTDKGRLYERRLELVRIPLKPHLYAAFLDMKSYSYDRNGFNPNRFMPMIRIPALDQYTKRLDWGITCQGCRFDHRRIKLYTDWTILYSSSWYEKHFQDCRVSQIGRKECSRYIARPGENQALLDDRFLSFLENFEFEFEFLAYYVAETQAYEWIEGTGIGPKFLGYWLKKHGLLDLFWGNLIEDVLKSRTFQLVRRLLERFTKWEFRMEI
jgi:hypothetical protein